MLSTQIKNLKTNWKELLQEVNAPLILELDTFLAEEKKVFSKHLACYPPEELILNAFNHFDVEKTRGLNFLLVVIPALRIFIVK